MKKKIKTLASMVLLTAVAIQSTSAQDTIQYGNPRYGNVRLIDGATYIPDGDTGRDQYLSYLNTATTARGTVTGKLELR